MIIPKPKHLGPEYAAQFSDQSVADAYVNYPPYSEEVFRVLDWLIQDEPRIVLDIGCGTGDVARMLAPLVERIDAVDPSAAMIEVGRACKDGDEMPEHQVGLPERGGISYTIPVTTSSCVAQAFTGWIGTR